MTAITMNLGMWSDPGWDEVKAISERAEHARMVREAGGILVDGRASLVREVLTPKEWRATR